MDLALAFMRQVKRGDYFQMSADYEYGVGAHSAIMISDYDPETDTITAEGFFDPDQPFTVTFSYDDNYNVVWTEDGESTVMDYSYRTDNG